MTNTSLLLMIRHCLGFIPSLSPPLVSSLILSTSKRSKKNSAATKVLLIRLARREASREKPSRDKLTPATKNRLTQPLFISSLSSGSSQSCMRTTKMLRIERIRNKGMCRLILQVKAREDMISCRFHNKTQSF